MKYPPLNLATKIAALSFLLSCAGAGPAIAGNFVVSNNADSGAGSLRAAVAAAEASSGPDFIRFSQSLAGATIVLSGDIEIGDGTGNLIIDASGVSPRVKIESSVDRIFTILNSSAGLSVINLVLEGNAPDGIDQSSGNLDGGDGENGGAILAGSNLVVSFCLIENCTAGRGGTASGSGDSGNGGSGGAIYCELGTNTVSILDSVFRQNMAGGVGGRFSSSSPVNGTGGAIASFASTLRVERSTFSENVAGGASGNFGGDINGGEGGAIWQFLGRLLATDSYFQGNRAGGGAEGSTGMPGENGGNGGNGGAILVINSGHEVNRCSFDSNQSGSGGSGGTGVFDFGGNGGTSGFGGAVHARSFSASNQTITVTNSTFFGNQTGSGGLAGTGINGGADGQEGNSADGSALSADVDMTIVLEHCTVTGNETGPGNLQGSGAVSGKFSPSNTVIAQNTNGDANGDIISQDGVNFFGDLFGINSGTTGSELTGDAKLSGVLASNGGLTPTVRPLSDSLLINGGAGLIAPVTEDQRTKARDLGLPDIGAFEALPQPDMRIGKKASPSTHRSTTAHNTSGAGQKIGVKLKGNRKGKFYFSIQNDGELNDTLTSKSNRPNRTLRLKVFRRTGGRANVTGQVIRSGFARADLAPAEVLVFECQIKRRSKKKKPRQTLAFSCLSALDTRLRDVSKAKIKGKQ